MSEYFNVRCITCNENSDDAGNHSKRAILEIAQHWPAMRGAYELQFRFEAALVDVEIRFPYLIMPFFQAHEDHDLEIVSEHPSEPRTPLQLRLCSPHIISDMMFCRVCGRSAESIVGSEHRKEHA